MRHRATRTAHRMILAGAAAVPACPQGVAVSRGGGWGECATHEHAVRQPWTCSARSRGHAVRQPWTCSAPAMDMQCACMNSHAPWVSSPSHSNGHPLRHPHASMAHENSGGAPRGSSGCRSAPAPGAPYGSHVCSARPPMGPVSRALTRIHEAARGPGGRPRTGPRPPRAQLAGATVAASLLEASPVTLPPNASRRIISRRGRQARVRVGLRLRHPRRAEELASRQGVAGVRAEHEERPPRVLVRQEARRAPWVTALVPADPGIEVDPVFLFPGAPLGDSPSGIRFATADSTFRAHRAWRPN